jgi:hypothetical protein
MNINDNYGKLTIFLILTIIILISGCTKSYEDRGGAAPSASPPAAQPLKASNAINQDEMKKVPDLVNTAAQATAMPRKIIKNGEIGLVVKSYDPFFNALQKQVADSGGYLSQIQVYRGTGSISSAQIVLRLPPEKLDPFIIWLRDQGILSSEKITAEDISEQYYDLQARLENARKFESRLLEMLKTQTGKLQDLVLVEEKLNQIREQIEQFEGKLRYFDNLVGMSTLTLNISVEEKYTSSKTVTFSDRASQAWNDSVQSLKDFFQTFGLILIAVVPWVIPFGVLIIIGWYSVKLIWRLLKRHK